ncbi:hypothetical protein RRG08_061092 [Elysia crispata]|uniref:YEATS domain-containing protein n=1 Tax=Elysia crispata TaxID=231223 RepID=A0AAE0ZP22_9GAST|nr:hypothetical protein RRG08_061092 [Elysia crispata]
MSAQKRSHEAVDPDYADAGEQQVKRQRVLEQDAKESVSKKIKTIVQNEFKKEINLKETELQNIDKRHSRFKIKKKIIVGNVSKYIPVDSREANDMSSHLSGWFMFVLPKQTQTSLGLFVKSGSSCIHSYKPNDLVEVSSPPFHLTRRGWGEFLLDKTFTGLENFVLKQSLESSSVLEKSEGCGRLELNRESSSILAWLGRPGVHSPCPESQLQNVPSSFVFRKRDTIPCKNNSEHKPLESQYAAAFKPHTSKT